MIKRSLLSLISLALVAAIGLSRPQNGLFSVAIEDPAGICVTVSAYSDVTQIQFHPEGNKPFESYDAKHTISSDTITITEEEDRYTANIRVRYRAPFSAEADIVWNGVSYTLRDADVRNSWCIGGGTQLGSILADKNPPPPLQPAILQVSASASSSIGHAPLVVAFNAVSNKTGTTFTWKDNGLTFATGPAASLTFALPSTHQIIVVGQRGDESASTTLVVTVLNRPSGGSGNGGNSSNGTGE